MVHWAQHHIDETESVFPGSCPDKRPNRPSYGTVSFSISSMVERIIEFDLI
jgi:hypothetical protein